MRRTFVPLMIATTGLVVGWAGQGIWRNSPDEIWAAVLVVSILGAAALAMEPTLARALKPITRRHAQRRTR